MAMDRRLPAKRYADTGEKLRAVAIVTCLLFGLAHVVNPYALLAGQWHPVWFAGPPMFCLALPFAFLRERTGGVLASALLHAWPQAIVSVRTLS